MSEQDRVCPICETALTPVGPRYELARLFALWHPIVFSASTREEHARQSGYTQLFRCPDCKLGIFLPQIIGTPRFYAEAYNLESTQSETGFTYSVQKWDFLEGLRDLRAGERVLEVGCGPGHFLNLLREVGCEPIGMESSPIAAAQARARGHTVHESLQPLLAGKDRFASIYAFHVIEHVPDPLHFLNDLRRLLQPGGRIGIAVPDQDGPIRLIEPCPQDMPPHHATRWSRYTFERAAQRVELRIARAAREPLTRDNAYYYLDYMPMGLIPGNSQVAAAARRAVRAALAAVVRLYLRLGLGGAGPFHGQALYVLLVSRATE
jgi:SAM-dependent methyltransferase